MREGIVPVMEMSGNGCNTNSFNGDWAWIIVLFLIFGYGRGFGGFGGFGGNYGVSDNYVLTSDFSQLSSLINNGFNSTERRLDSITNGICTLGYDNLVQTNNINSNINSLGMTLQNCCCDLRQQIADTSCVTQRAIDGVNYNMSQSACAITNAINNGIRDVMTNCNNNYQNLHEEIVQNRIEDKNNQIAMLQTKLNNAELKASQEAQSNYLYTAITDKLSPCPRPAYITCNPNAPLNYSINYGCGCGM